MARESATSARLRRAQLSDFLRTRRARLTPGDVGLADTGRRRTPGLRREEVAILAGVGVSWYTWLEQGRDINVSSDVLDAVAGALRLGAAERAHLYVLAGLNPPRTAMGDTEVSAALRDLVEGWAPRPATLRDRYWNLLVVNSGARALFGYDADTDGNCLVAFFTNARYRAVHDAWSGVAPAVVAAYRADAAQAPGDPGFLTVIETLSERSAEFARLWASHDVALPGTGHKAVRHPRAGELHFDTTTLAVADHPGWYIDFYNPRPGTAERLEELASTPLAALA